MAAGSRAARLYVQTTTDIAGPEGTGAACRIVRGDVVLTSGAPAAVRACSAAIPSCSRTCPRNLAKRTRIAGRYQQTAGDQRELALQLWKLAVPIPLRFACKINDTDRCGPTGTEAEAVRKSSRMQSVGGARGYAPCLAGRY